jgi:hypothetical protein
MTAEDDYKHDTSRNARVTLRSELRLDKGESGVTSWRALG